MKSKQVHISVDYNKRGDYSDDDEMPICARYIERGIGEDVAKFYFVLVNRNERLYNPLEDSMTKMGRKDEQAKLKKCSSDVFYSYLKFLKTNNQTFLKMANRQLITES